MDPRALVKPLESRWQDIVDAVLRPMGRPELSTKDVARLAPKVTELSRAYNGGQAEGRRTKLPLEARVAFSFPRDVPKGAGAVRELVASGVLTIPEDRPLRVLDLGAGLGAMTWGIVRALVASGQAGRVEALLVDEDPEVLQKAEAIARAARGATAPVEVAITTRVSSLGSALEPKARTNSAEPKARTNSAEPKARTNSAEPKARTNLVEGLGAAHDLVVLGQVLSEMDPRSEPAARVESQAALVSGLLATAVAPGGALVIVEPALRERTRHLHALRDRLLAGGLATVFAPCLHAATCPMLAIETEWCHEDLAIDLPPWVTPIARAAGLRWQGLTFSYLVLRKDGALQAPRLARGAGQVRFRAVSDLLRSKGKAELFVCGEAGARERIRRLDRDAAHESGVPFHDLRRGDIVTVSSAASSSVGAPASQMGAPPPEPPIDERGRVAAKAHVAIDVGAARK